MKYLTNEDLHEFLSKSRMELASTHTRLSLPIIIRIYKKMKANLKFPAIKVDGNIICDGHHRYIASLLANYQLEKISWVSSSSIVVIDWDTVSFDQNVWDSPKEVEIRNQQDAIYNEMTLSEIVALLA